MERGFYGLCHTFSIEWMNEWMFNDTPAWKLSRLFGVRQWYNYVWKFFHQAPIVNKLCYVKPVLGDWRSSCRRCRKDEVVLCCVSIGHTHLTYSHILRRDHPFQWALSVYFNRSTHFGCWLQTCCWYKERSRPLFGTRDYFLMNF